jgi:hypothetical protein
LGRKTVRVQIGKDRKEFTIQEDLLFADSPYFRAKLQPKRKSLQADEKPECAVCHEPIEVGAEELTHCAQSCGTNFHHDCIMRWKAEKRGQASNQCPMCRSNWVVEDDVIKTHVFKKLDAPCYSIYQEWLYRGHICVPDDDPSGVMQIVSLTRAYLFGAHISDNRFCVAVLEASLETYEELRQYPGPAAVTKGYRYTVAGSPWRRFIVRLYMHYAKSKWLENETIYPQEFLKDLLVAKMEKEKPESQWTVEEAKKELCEGDNEDHAAGYNNNRDRGLPDVDDFHVGSTYSNDNEED